jgi:membrane protease YdiL (CAAX protease family)
MGFLAGGTIISVTMPIVSALGLSTTESGLRRLAELSIGLRVIIVLTAGITEEIQYRGYLIERLNALTGRLGLSTAISWILFMLLHIRFWGLGGALQIGIASVVLYALYFWRRNLLACILMHVLNDAVAFLLIPTILQHVS